MTSLANNNLLRTQLDWGDEPRFGMLETVREFGLERLEASGQLALLKRRHAGYFLRLAERAWPAFVNRLELEPWIERFEMDHDNFRAALKWSIENDESTIALPMAGRLCWFWYLRGYLGEALFISPRSAQGHVARLFDKLGVSTRTAAVAAALQADLVRDHIGS